MGGTQTKYVQDPAILEQLSQMSNRLSKKQQQHERTLKQFNQLMLRQKQNAMSEQRMAQKQDQMNERIRQIQRNTRLQKEQKQQQIQRLKDQMYEKQQSMRQQLNKTKIYTEKQIKKKAAQLEHINKQMKKQDQLIAQQRQKARVQAIKQKTAMKTMDQQLKQYKKQIEEEKKKATDPATFKQKKDQVFIAFLQNLKTYKFTGSFQKRNKQWHIVIGPISVGKSSLLNKFLGLKLISGVGQTTPNAAVVSESDRTVIMDSPGANDDFDFYDIQNLTLFKNIDRVFILYNTSFKQIAKICNIMKILKPKSTYLIRTKCDDFDNAQQRNQRGLDEQLDHDKKQVKQFTGHDFPIYANSSRKQMNYRDNQTTRKLIRGD